MPPKMIEDQRHESDQNHIQMGGSHFRRGMSKRLFSKEEAQEETELMDPGTDQWVVEQAIEWVCSD